MEISKAEIRIPIPFSIFEFGAIVILPLFVLFIEVIKASPDSVKLLYASVFALLIKYNDLFVPLLIPRPILLGILSLSIFTNDSFIEEGVSLIESKLQLFHPVFIICLFFIPFVYATDILFVGALEIDLNHT